MTTSEPLPNGGDANHGQLFEWWPADSPASHSPQRVSSVALLTSVGAGRGSLTPFARYDPTTSSWKTSQTSFAIPTLSDGYSQTWPTSGSMQTGVCYLRALWVHHIDDAACSSWLTPLARDYKGYTKRSGGSICNQLRRLYGGTGRPNPRWL